MFNTIAIQRGIRMVGLAVKKAAPTILTCAGVAGTIGGAVLACRETLRAEEILAEHNANIDIIKKVATEPEFEGKYTEQEYKQDLTSQYIKTGFALAKLYSPAIGLICGGIACIFSSHLIMKRREAALLAGISAISSSIDAYTQRLRERHPEIVEELHSELPGRIETVEEGKIDPVTGDVYQATKEIRIVKESDLTGYQMLFNSNSRNHLETLEYNRMEITSALNKANNKLALSPYLTLNKLWEMLGLDDLLPSNLEKAGQVVGWVNRPDLGVQDRVEVKVTEVFCEKENDTGDLERCFLLEPVGVRLDMLNLAFAPKFNGGVSYVESL